MVSRRQRLQRPQTVLRAVPGWSHTIECTWSWLRQAIRTYCDVSKIYLALYVAQFEFFFNHRHTGAWGQTLDLLQVAFQADSQGLLDRVAGAKFAEVCPVAG